MSWLSQVEKSQSRPPEIRGAEGVCKKPESAERGLERIRRLDRLVERLQLDQRLFGPRLVQRAADRALQAGQAVRALQGREHGFRRSHQGEGIDGFFGGLHRDLSWACGM